MKNHDEIAAELFERRDKYIIEQKRKRKRIAATCTAVVCALTVAVGAGIKITAVPVPENSSSIDRLPEIGENDHWETVDNVSVSPEIIASYEGNSSDAACYVRPPADGTYFFSIELNHALEDEYKNLNGKPSFLLKINIFDEFGPVDDETETELYSRFARLTDSKIYKAPVWEFQGENAEHVYRTEIIAVVPYAALKELSEGGKTAGAKHDYIDDEHGYFFDFIHNGDSSPIDLNDCEPIVF